jgi:hypothetical protein
LAVAVPELEAVAPNVVVPQPLLEGVANPANVNPGRTRSILSFAANGSFNANLNMTEEGAAVNGAVIANVVCWKAGAGYTIAGDSAIGVSTTLVEFDSKALAVLEARLAVCAAGHVVAPVAIVAVHLMPAFKTAPPDVSVIAADDVPEFEALAPKDVLPQPLVVGAASALKVKFGKMIETVSPTASVAVNENVKDNDTAVEVPRSENDSIEYANVGASSAVDIEIAEAGMFVLSAITMDVVRVFKLVVCALVPDTTPVAIVTAHCESAGSVLVAAVSLTAAEGVPELLALETKVVVPQPLAAVVRAPAMVKSGSAKVT